jgi:23S rRNA (uridine2552-2'-O)-methyltransferase
MSGPRRSSGTWRERQERDPFVRKARQEGWRSRAVYKLEEIAAKERLLVPGMTCVDLGAAPGGWSQYVVQRLSRNVRVVAVDILPMESMPCVDFLQIDFSAEEGLAVLLQQLQGAPVDLVMSDLAPNITGTKAIDQPRSMHLAELALDTAQKVLRQNGDFVCKLFQGEGSDDFVARVRQSFEKVRIIKPKASRPGSSEVYLVARNYRL